MFSQIQKWAEGGGVRLHHIAVLFHAKWQIDAFTAYLDSKQFKNYRALAINPQSDTAESEDAAQRLEDLLVIGTIHSSKGLEFEIVFVYAFDAINTIAMKNANDKRPAGQETAAKRAEAVAKRAEAVEELRRVLYVGCSRPRGLLYILYERENAFIAPVLAPAMRDHVERVDLDERRSSGAGALLALERMEPSMDRLTAGRVIEEHE
jgi:ATP-dependent exoDNAse (exonuclease V) beta subunit